MNYENGADHTYGPDPGDPGVGVFVDIEAGTVI
jgi:hypothetical protein